MLPAAVSSPTQHHASAAVVAESPASTDGGLQTCADAVLGDERGVREADEKHRLSTTTTPAPVSASVAEAATAAMSTSAPASVSVSVSAVAAATAALVIVCARAENEVHGRVERTRKRVNEGTWQAEAKIRAGRAGGQST
eukprot:1608735-Rhodomonas_salina.4